MKKSDSHYGVVQQVEGGKSMARCECGWSDFEDDYKLAEQELDRHVTKHAHDADGGTQL